MTESSTTGSRLVAEIAEAERAERTRLADRLHDEGLQLVLAARQEVSELRDGDPDALDALQADLEQATEALRSLTSAMHEDILDRLPLPEALDRMGSDAARRGRFTLELAVDPDASDVHDALVRDIARELLANAARHAEATRVRLEVTAIDDHLLVRVADDGKGVDPRTRLEAARAGHLGLGRLERTVAELGGRFALDSNDADGGKGTTASAWLPRKALAAQGSLEDALRGERRWSAALLAALQDGLVVFRDGVTVQVNDAFCRMTGFRREELLGTTPDNYPFWHDEDRASMKESIEDAHARRGLEQTHELRHRSGRRFPVLSSSARIDDPVGDEIGMLVVIKDLTERRRAEEQQRLEVELRTTIETTRRLTALLNAVDRGVPALVDALGGLLVDHLGWQAAVVNLRDPTEDRWDITWTSTPDIAAALAGPPVRDADWAPYLHPRFVRRGAVFVPAGTQTLPDHMPMHTPAWEPAPVADAWQAEDLLLVPMRSGEGLVGLLSMDCPRSGLRPTDTELDALVAAADHAAGALVMARRAGSRR